MSLSSWLYLSQRSLRRFLSLSRSLPLWLHVGDSPSLGLQLSVLACNSPTLNYLPSLIFLQLWLLSTQPIAQGLASITLSSSKTLPLTRVVASTLCPYSPSWQITLNFYIRLREVSLLLMAIFRLPLLQLQNIASFFLVLLADDMSISTLTAIAGNHTRPFLYSRLTTTRQKTSTSKTIALHKQLLILPTFQVLRVRITRLSILSLILPALHLASITECSNFLSTYCFYFETTFDSIIENSLLGQ